jgi:hypothetical protein
MLQTTKKRSRVNARSTVWGNALKTETPAGRSSASAVARSDGARTPSRGQSVTSVDWTRALLRSDVIELPGFAGPVISAKGVPWIKFGPDSADASALNANSIASRIRMRTVVVLAVACAIATFACGSLLQIYLGSAAIEQRKTSTLPAWKVVHVDAEGVTVGLVGTANKSLRVQVGKALPNGELLLQTDPARRIYRTPTASVLVREDAN